MSTTESERSGSVPSSANSSNTSLSLASSTATSGQENDDLNLIEDQVQSTTNTNYDEPEPAFGRSEGQALSISWLSSINLSSEAQDKLCFPESLLLVNDKGTPFGKVHFSIVKSEWENNKCLLVYSESSFYDKKLDLHCGTSITGFISPNLTTLQEFTHEWVKQADVYRERKIFLMRENDNKIFYKMVNTEGSEIKNEIKKFIIDEDGGDRKNGKLLTESSNILFHRLLAFEKSIGSIDLSCLDHCGRICRNSYKYTGTGYEDVYGEKVKVWSIRRSVSSLADNSQICQFDSLFTYHARLILRCQPEGQNDFAMIPLTFKCVEPNEIDTGGNIPPVKWECDQEYLHNFLVHKEKLALENKGYLLDHPEINAILADLMSSILMKKPSNVVEFCSNFFQPYLNYQPIIFTSIKNLSLPDDDSDADASETVNPAQQEQYETGNNEGEVVSTSTTTTDKGDFNDGSSSYQNGSIGESSNDY